MKFDGEPSPDQPTELETPIGRQDPPTNKADDRGQSSPSLEAIGPIGEPNLGLMANFIGFHLRRAHDASYRTFVAQAGRRHLGQGRFASLMVIGQNPGINQTMLGRAIARDKSTISPLLQDLERRDLIERRAAAGDNRSFVLNLTPAGESFLAELLEHVRIYERILDDVIGERKSDFIALLQRITRELG